MNASRLEEDQDQRPEIERILRGASEWERQRFVKLGGRLPRDLVKETGMGTLIDDDEGAELNAGAKGISQDEWARRRAARAGDVASLIGTPDAPKPASTGRRMRSVVCDEHPGRVFTVQEAAGLAGCVADNIRAACNRDGATVRGKFHFHWADGDVTRRSPHPTVAAPAPSAETEPEAADPEVMPTAEKIEPPAPTPVSWGDILYGRVAPAEEGEPAGVPFSLGDIARLTVHLFRANGPGLTEAQARAFWEEALRLNDARRRLEAMLAGEAVRPPESGTFPAPSRKRRGPRSREV